MRLIVGKQINKINMAKLLGKADQTLVRGAYRAARAKAQADSPDLTPQFESNKRIAKTITDSVTGVMDMFNAKKEQEEAAHDKNLKPFKDVANKAYKKLYELKEPLPQKVIDAVEAEVNKLQDEFEAVNTMGDGDTRENERERIRITAQLQKITNEAINTRAKFMQMGQAAGDWNPSLIDPEDIDPMKSILDLDGMDKNDNISVEFVDGKLTFNTENYSTGTRIAGGLDSPLADPEEEYQYGDTRSFTAEGMFNALPTKNMSHDAMVLSDLSGSQKQAKADKKGGLPNYWETPGIFEDEKATWASKIKDEKIFQDMASRQMEGVAAPSFKNGLRNRVDIPMDILNNMLIDNQGKRIGIENLDRNGDGFVNAKDLVGAKGDELTAFENNMDNLIDILTNINNPAFNFKTSQDLLADYFTNLKKQAYNRFNPVQTQVTQQEDFKSELSPESYDYDDDNIGEGAPMRPGQGSAFKFNPDFI
tara:strand:+ start:940 stop:2373 length:1434 start_codon:yes stop_codon:yes gene_type:complete